MRLVLVFGVITAIALVIAASTSTTAFGQYNTGWDGASDIRSIAEQTGATTTLARETRAYQQTQPSRTIAFILSPDQAYHPRAQERLRSFVEAGGTVVIAADYGAHANSLLTGLGAQARLDGHSLRDEEVYYQSPAMPVARNVTAHPQVAGVQAVTLNHGTAVVPHNASVLVRTSGYAYLDENANENLDTTESLAAYPVVTSERLGTGRVIVVSDPSIFINIMLDRPGNQAFVRQLISGHAHVLLDYSHTAGVPPLMTVLLILRESALWQFLCGLLGTLTVAGVVSARSQLAGIVQRAFHPAQADHAPAVTETELVAYLQQQYPDWEAPRLRRVVSIRSNRHHEDD